MFIVVLVTITKTWKQPKCPSTWTEKEDNGVCVCVYTHTPWNDQDSVQSHSSVRLFVTSWTAILAYMVFHIHHGLLLSYKKGNHAICCNMDGPRDYHTKWSKTEKDMISLIYGILKSIQMKKKVYKWIYIQEDSQTQNTYIWLSNRKWIYWEYGINRCTLPYIKQINKDLLYSTGNYVQYVEITCNRKDSVKENVYMYNWIILLHTRS